MLSGFKAWVAQRRHCRQRQDYQRGFDTAAGSLLRKESTPKALAAQYSASIRARTQFDYGMEAAVEFLIARGLVADDRIY